MKDVSATALLTACSRSKYENLSLDPIAKYWLTEDAYTSHLNYTKTTPPWEVELICLRNRFFLETSKLFFNTNNGVLFNLGAGLSSLGVLLPDSVLAIEMDLDEKNLLYKEKMIRELKKRHVISPKKNIIFHVHNFENSLPSRETFIPEESSNLPVCFVLEGLIYYLSRTACRNIFDWINSFPAKQIQVVMTFWKPEMRENPFLKNYQNYLLTNQMNPNLLFLETNDILDSFPSFQRHIETDYLRIAEEINLTPRFHSNHDIFGESFIVLNKGLYE